MSSIPVYWSGGAIFEKTPLHIVAQHATFLCLLSSLKLLSYFHVFILSPETEISGFGKEIAENTECGKLTSACRTLYYPP
jgi:hypothetical protein